MMFKALMIHNQDHYTANIVHLPTSSLPEGEVIVQVDYSSVNYKDALAICGTSPIVKDFPMIPGIDLAGKVIKSKSQHYQIGDHVLLNGWGVGEKYWGGLSQLASVSASWLIPLPKGITSKQAMAVGTAGYTAMLAINTLERHGLTPAHGKVVVTGANGGVGSFAIAWLAKLGYHVIAVTGRPHEENYLLQTLGAKEILNRNQFSQPGKPLTKAHWVAAIDCVGSHTLANICAGTAYGGIVVTCGLAQGMDFPASVAPFILRGITLAGIDSVMCSYPMRLIAWQRITELLEPSLLDTVSTEIKLNQVITKAHDVLAGKIRGRLVVQMADH